MVQRCSYNRETDLQSKISSPISIHESLHIVPEATINLSPPGSTVGGEYVVDVARYFTSYLHSVRNLGDQLKIRNRHSIFHSARS